MGKAEENVEEGFKVSAGKNRSVIIIGRHIHTC